MALTAALRSLMNGCPRDPVLPKNRERPSRTSPTPNQGELAGFYSLSAHAMERSNIAGGWLQRNVPERVPMILLGMLGVDRRFQGEGLGRKLLHDAVIRSLNISSELGARALIVDPVDSAAARFYENNGFQHIPESERMFLKLAGKHLV